MEYQNSYISIKHKVSFQGRTVSSRLVLTGPTLLIVRCQAILQALSQEVASHAAGACAEDFNLK